MKTTLLCGLLLVVSSIAQRTVNASVVNVVYSSDISSFVRDAGILSSPGGNFWNEGQFFGPRPLPMSDLFDEFNAQTATDVVLVSGVDTIAGATSTPFGVSQNFLGGSSSVSGVGIIEFRDLIPGSNYNLAIYVTNDRFAPPVDTFAVTGAGGTVTQSSTGVDPVPGLPGVANRDYLLFSNVTAFDLGGGVAGIRVEGTSGTFAGLQISGKFNPAPVPEPLSLITWSVLGIAGVIGYGCRRVWA